MVEQRLGLVEAGRICEELLNNPSSRWREGGRLSELSQDRGGQKTENPARTSGTIAGHSRTSLQNRL